MNISAIDYICDRIMNSDDFDDSYRRLFEIISYKRFNEHPNISITTREYHRLLKYSDFLSNSDNSLYRNLSLKIISSLYELYRTEPSCQLIVKSVLNKFGLFSAEDKFVDERLHLPIIVELIGEYRKKNQKIGNTASVFTNAQYEIYKSILNNKHFSFSGPTSLGKSFLIKNTAIDLISSVDNIVFILPTKALLEEYLIDFRSIINERNIDNVNLTKSVSGFNERSKNILIFTQERYNNFLFDKNFSNINIDVLFVDEAHKLADKNNKRTITLFKVIRRTIDICENVKLVFSSPVISNPEVFFKIFKLNNNVKSLVVKESPVTQNLYFSNLVNGKVKYFDIIKKEVIEFSLTKGCKNGFDLISSMSESSNSNLIFISNKVECMKKCEEFIIYMINKGKLIDSKDLELINESNFISEFVHEDFILAKYLRYGIALHNGSLPTFIRKRIEDLYSRKKIKYIFCTSTLLEGVNLPTQNVFIYPFKKQLLENTEKCNLDFWNLAGRAGRYRNELSGNIICIDEFENSWKVVEERAKEDKGININDNFSSLLSKHTKILNYLNGKTKSPDKGIKELSSLILSEVLEYGKNGSIGSLLMGFHSEIREKIISSSLSHMKEKSILDIDPIAFSSNHNFDSELQSKANRYARNPDNRLKSYSREDVLDYINIINDIYKIRTSESATNQLFNVAYSWLRGSSLSTIIKNGIEYSKKVRDPEKYGHWIDFNKNDPIHLNQKITEIITCIEHEVTFQLESCCSHFFQLTKSIHGELFAGFNLAPLLEYGTMDKKEIALQDYGFSRLAASEIVKKYSQCITFPKNESKLIIKIDMLKELIKEDSLISKELNWMAK